MTNHRRGASDAELRITGRGIAHIVLGVGTTTVEKNVECGGMAKMKGATGSQDGTPTNGSTVTAGANGIMATKTADGAKANPKRRATPKDLLRGREKGAATREGMPQIAKERGPHLHLVVPLHQQPRRRRHIGLGETPGSWTPLPTRLARAVGSSPSASWRSLMELCTLRSPFLMAQLNGTIGKRL